MIAARPCPPMEWPTVWRLARIGALVGGAISAVLAGVAWALPLGVDGVLSGVVTGLTAGAPFGAVCGAVVGPVAGLSMLRPVPLRMALLVPAIGTLIGGSVGFSRAWIRLDIVGPDPVSGGFVGFVTGVVLVRGVWQWRQRFTRARLL